MDHNQCHAWIDKAELLKWLEYRINYCLLAENMSARDAYRDVIAHVRLMTTHVKMPDIAGLR